MKLDSKKVQLAWARSEMTTTQLASKYGCTQQSMTALLNRTKVNPVTAGKLARALGVDVTEILED